MAAKRKKRPLRSRTPSRVKKRTKKGRARSHAHQHPELVGLGLAAIGLFLASLLYLGWDGGPVGGTLVDWLDSAVGAA